MLTDSGERVKRYDMKQEPLTLGEARLDSMRLYTIDGKFARVAIYYRGQSIHTLVLAYLVFYVLMSARFEPRQARQPHK